MRYVQVRALRDDELGWEDMLSEADALAAGFSWVRLPPPSPPAVAQLTAAQLAVLNCALVLASCANAAYLASRTREYTHFHTREPLATQHARFVPAEDIFGRPDGAGEPARATRVARVAWKLVRATWCVTYAAGPRCGQPWLIVPFCRRWMTGAEGPPPIEAMVDGRVIQKVDMWMPEEFEKTFFA